MVLGVGACAASPRIVYQGNAAFEYCYAAEQKPKVTLAQREACWSAWLAHYTRHQDLNRVDYALRRQEALQMGDPTPPPPAIASSAGSEGPADPATLGFGVTDEGDPIRSPNSMKPYAVEGDNSAKTGCLVTCEQLSVECIHACQPGFEPCLETCKADQRICLGGCY